MWIMRLPPTHCNDVLKYNPEVSTSIQYFFPQIFVKPNKIFIKYLHRKAHHQINKSNILPPGSQPHITILSCPGICWSNPTSNLLLLSQSLATDPTVKCEASVHSWNDILWLSNDILSLFITCSNSLSTLSITWNQSHFVFMWLVVLPVFLPPACCYPSSVPELRVISTERMEHLFLIFLPKKNTFFPNESALGKHIFQICAEMANVLAALTGPCTVWPSLPLTPSGAHHSLPHVVPVILASVSF